MWSLVLTVALNLHAYPMTSTRDGLPVYMWTTSFRVAVGQFSSLADCQTYAAISPPPYEPVVVKFTDDRGIEYEFPVTPTKVNGCVKVS